MKRAAKIIRIETICNGSSPSSTNNLKKRNDAPQSKDTDNKVIKSLVFIMKKRPLKKRGLSISKSYVGSRSYLVSAVTS